MDIILAAIVWLTPAQPMIAIPADGDCGSQLYDMGYRGISGDGQEAIYAPLSVVRNVCD